MERYIYSGLTKTELKQVKLSRILDKENDFIAFLSGILSAFINLKSKNPNRFYLWIDEMEDLIYYNSKHYKIFSQTVRDLCDRLNKNFTIFLNFTLAEPEETTIKMLLGEALWDRINQKIRFKELSIDGSILYCRDLINYAQYNTRKEFVPFNKDSIKLILENIPSAELTPREINKRCSVIIEYSLKEGISNITKQIVSKYYNDNTVENEE